MKQRYLIPALRLAAATLSFAFITAATPAFAADFTNSHLVDDSVFDNAGAMSEAQIQSFLSTVGSTCLVNYKDVEPTWNGTQWTYSGSVPASKIIYKAAQQWGINPQVIIATLQKEQSLITGTCSSQTPYNSAMGYDCPDSGTLHDYPEIGVTGTCVAHQKYVGFTKQVLWGSWQLKFSKERSEGNVAWDGDGDITFAGFMTQGTFKRCSACVTNFYSGSVSIDGQSIYLENGATASLYTYTPHLGQSFPGLFEKWFGSVRQYQYGRPASHTLNSTISCKIPSYDSSKVGRLYNPDTQDYLYTVSQSEACFATTYGYIWDGIAFENATASGAVPVYRLANSVRHLFTTDVATRDAYINNRGYHSEGTAFMVYMTQIPGTIPAYWLEKNLTTFITSGGGEKTYFEQAMQFTSAGVSFFTPSASTAAPVYRYQGQKERVYTPSQLEGQSLAGLGYASESAGFSELSSWETQSLPVYRLVGPTGHFYTRDRVERDVAVIVYGFLSEGTAFQSPVSTGPGAKPVYRLTNYATGKRLYTSDTTERSSAVASFGYTDEGTAFYGN